jgi:hypothetical protein
MALAVALFAAALVVIASDRAPPAWPPAPAARSAS